MFVAVYQALTIPIQISFDPDVFNNTIMKFIASMLDLIFLVDIILNFRTSYIDIVDGEEVLDSM